MRDTWAFDPSSEQWTKLDDAPGDPRGGTAITFTEGKVWRFGGYDGKQELGGGIDYLPFTGSPNLDEKWSTISYPSSDDTETSGPEPRSVAALHPFASGLVLLFGEGKPSPTGGHDAAGNFWGDVWSFDPKRSAWKRIEPTRQVEKEQGGPEERGWFASDVDGEGSVVIWGGLDGRNERLSDGWILSEN